MNRLLLRALPVLLVALCACAAPPADVPARTSRTFSHDLHLRYFASGTHRQEKIAMHLELFGGATEVPDDLAQGKCTECHDNLAEMACGTCHVAFQQAALRSRREVRPCVGCHRGSWIGTAATLPRPVTCAACHSSKSNPPGAITAVRFEREAAEYAGGMRVSSLPPNVYFSHRAHVRFGGVACGRCHTAPPTAGSTPGLPAFAMTDCLRCHVENGASTDCLTCHK